MMSRILDSIDSLAEKPRFSQFYQDYIKDMQDAIIDNETKQNEWKMSRLKSLNSVLRQLNELTEELKHYD